MYICGVPAGSGRFPSLEATKFGGDGGMDRGSRGQGVDARVTEGVEERNISETISFAARSRVRKRTNPGAENARARL